MLKASLLCVLAVALYSGNALTGRAINEVPAFTIASTRFLIAFVVMCSGITSASTASRFFAANFFEAFHFSWGTAGIVVVALLFMFLLALVNLRGVGESVKLNVVLTIIEISGLMLVIIVGLFAFTGGGDVDFSRVVHGDQRFSYTRPIVAGDELTGVMTVTSVKSLAGNSMITSETVITDATGAHVVTATSSLVVRGEE